MTPAASLDQLKSHLERLRRDSLDVVANAARIVFEGVQKLADQELKALNDYYKSAAAGLKAPKAAGAAGYQDMALQQLDLLQDTVQKVLGHARESLGILTATRSELARLVSAPPPAAAKALDTVVAPAQKAVADLRKVAEQAQKTAVKTAQDLRKTVEKELAAAEKKGRAAVRQTETRAREASATVKHKIGSVLDVTAPPVSKKAVSARPSPESRASRATSKAKQQPTRRKSGS